MKYLTVYELQELSYALEDVYGYLTDNSCSDPDCCGGPFYEVEQYEEGLKVLEKFGIGVHGQGD